VIDVEGEIYTAIAEELRARYPDISVLGELVLSPSKFPCVCIEEFDNYSFRQSRTNDSNENHAVVMYEVNVFTNRTSGKKSECKKIFGTVDRVMNTVGFTRLAALPITLDEGTKYRLVGRYTAIVSTNSIIYRRN